MSARNLVTLFVVSSALVVAACQNRPPPAYNEVPHTSSPPGEAQTPPPTEAPAH